MPTARLSSTAEHFGFRNESVVTVKILCISDTHGYHRKLVLPEADVLIHAGDVSKAGTAAQIEDFASWFVHLPYQHKVCIAGNHDFGLQDTPALVNLFRGVTFLQDSFITIGGLKFYGSPYVPAYGNWAFMLPRGLPLAQKWQQIPEDTDVLITHGPAKGILDIVKFPTGFRAGCADLAVRLKSVKPLLHVFGHIHEGHGVQLGATTYVNASFMDWHYRPANSPILVETDGVMVQKATFIEQPYKGA